MIKKINKICISSICVVLILLAILSLGSYFLTKEKDKTILSTNSEDNIPIIKTEDFTINSSHVLTKYVGTDTVLMKENFPNGITKIGVNAFTGTMVQKVELPDMIDEVMINSFWGCSNLEEIIFQKNILAIGNGSLAFCPKLKKVVANFTTSSVFKLEVFTFMPKTFEIIVPYDSYDSFSTQINLGAYKSLVVTKSVEINCYDASTNYNSKINQYFGQIIETLPVLERDGYIFDGWYNENGQKTENGIIISNYTNFTLNAHWIKEKYAFKIINPNGNKWISTNSTIVDNKAFVDFGFGINLETLKENYTQSGLSNKAGYVFKGFSRDGQNIISDWTIIGDEGKNFCEISLIPIWEKEVYNIQFITQLDNVILNSVNYSIGDIFNSPTNLLVKENFEYDGWHTFEYKNEDDGFDYENIIWKENFYNGMPITDFTPNQEGNKTIILLAKWIPQYQINFDTSGGTEISPLTCAYENNINGLPGTANKNGYKFVEWQYDGVKIENGDIYPTRGDITLIAIWSLVTYNITYTLNGGILENPICTYNAETPTFNLQIPTKFAYRFNYWQLDGIAKMQVAVGSFGNINLVANWNGYVYTFISDAICVINHEVSIVDFSQATSETSMNFSIGSNVKEVTFLGNNKLLLNKTFSVDTRLENLIMRLKGVHIYGQNNKSGINAENCPNLILEVVGDNFVGSGYKTEFYNNMAGLNCQNVTINGDFLSLSAAATIASGIKGNDAIHANGFININATRLDANGGNGARGSNGISNTMDRDYVPLKASEGNVGTTGVSGYSGTDAGPGGNGGVGIFCTSILTIKDGSIVNVSGGDGGDGGIGGSGGKGGKGGEGADAVPLGSSGKKGGNGGIGGNGGRGGFGGNAGRPITANGGIVGKYSSTISYGGDGGKGGTRGAGGDGGLGGFYLNSETRRYPSGSTSFPGINGANGLKGGNEW